MAESFPSKSVLDSLAFRGFGNVTTSVRENSRSWTAENSPASLHMIQLPSNYAAIYRTPDEDAQPYRFITDINGWSEEWELAEQIAVADFQS